MTVKYYRIPKDERMMEEIICQECGRSIVNIIEIDGVPYGMNCGKKKLGLSKVSKKKMKRILFEAKQLRFHLYNEKGREYDVRICAYNIFRMLNLPDPWSNGSIDIQQYGEMALELVS